MKTIPGAEGWFIAFTVVLICIACTGFGVWFDTGPGPRGTYQEARAAKSDKYQGRPVRVEIIKRDRRCDGPARYEAMREAYEAGRPQPC